MTNLGQNFNSRINFLVLKTWNETQFAFIHELHQMFFRSSVLCQRISSHKISLNPVNLNRVSFLHASENSHINEHLLSFMTEVDCTQSCKLFESLYNRASGLGTPKTSLRRYCSICIFPNVSTQPYASAAIGEELGGSDLIACQSRILQLELDPYNAVIFPCIDQIPLFCSKTNQKMKLSSIYQ